MASHDCATVQLCCCTSILSLYLTCDILLLLVLLLLLIIVVVIVIIITVVFMCFSISQNKLTAILKHYDKNGAIAWAKLNWGGRKYNTKALTPEDTERVVQLLQNFAEDHELVLPEESLASEELM